MDKIIEHALCDRCHSELYSDWDSDKKTEEPIKFASNLPAGECHWWENGSTAP